MSSSKERIKITEVKESKNNTKVVFSNGLQLTLSEKDLLTFTNHGFVSWKEGVAFDLKSDGTQKTLNPVGTNIFYKI